MLVPHDRFFRRLHARRRHPVLEGRVGRPKMVRTGAAELLAAQGIWRSGAGYWYRGPTPPPEHEAATRLTLDAGAVLERGELPEGASLELLAAVETMADGGSIVTAIAEKFGLVRALAVKLRSLELMATTVSIDKVSRHVVSARRGGTAADPTAAKLAFLRELVCNSDDESYAAARSFAATARESPSVTVPQRAALSFIFPEEPAWAEADLRQVLTNLPQGSTIQAFALLFGSITDAALVESWLAKAPNWIGWTLAPFYSDLALRLEPTLASRVLGGVLRRSLKGRRPDLPEAEALAVALLALRTPEVAELWAELFLHPTFARHARDWFRTHAPAARELVFAALTPKLEEKSIVGDLTRRMAASVSAEEAPPAELVGVELPAWVTALPTPRPRTPDLRLPRPAPAGAFPWFDGERERLRVEPPTSDIRPMTPEIVDKWRALAPSARYVDVWAQWENGKWSQWRVPDAEGLALWNQEASAPLRESSLKFLARHGDAAFPGLLLRDAFTELVRVWSPAVAIACARALRLQSRKRLARGWLRVDPKMSVEGLLPYAFGPPGRRRRDAEQALRWLAYRDRSLIEAAAAKLAPDAAKVVTEWLAQDVLVQSNLPRSPGRFGRLPQLRLRDGRVLPRAISERVVLAIRTLAPIALDPRLLELRELLDSGSRDELAFTLFCEWVMSGGTRSSSWLTHGVAWLGTTATLRRIWPFLHYWSIRSARRAALILDALEIAGTDEALALVARVYSARHGGVLEPIAKEIFDEAAEAREITLGELTFRLAPRFGGEPGRDLVLDLGSRRFRVRLGDDLSPSLVDEDGRVLQQLPRPRKEDDVVKAALAAERWRWIAAEAKAAARSEVHRLELAMLSGQRWTTEAFRRSLLQHPFLSILARRLVWSCDGATFRVAEDGELADEHDRATSLSGAEVWLPHPLHLDPELIARWADVFSDYGVVQPFHQLGRAIFVMPESIRAGKTLTSTQGRVLPARRIVAVFHAFGMVQPGNPNRISLRKKDGTMAYAFVSLTPGIGLRHLDSNKVQTLGVITLYGAQSFAEIDDVSCSELMRVADALR